jgi:catechol 2,3-dioxygenase-like lactoylglutathione lyase family enzyme
MENKFRNLITGILHIGIPTNDIDKTILFYQKLGFEVKFSTVNNNEKVAFLKLGDVVIETYENKQAVMKEGAINHIALNVTDVMQLYKMAKESNYKLLNDEVEFLPFWENGVKFFTILGPNNEQIEFSQYL